MEFSQRTVENLHSIRKYRLIIYNRHKESIISLLFIRLQGLQYERMPNKSPKKKGLIKTVWTKIKRDAVDK